jgi:hypothetical protein
VDLAVAAMAAIEVVHLKLAQLILVAVAVVLQTVGISPVVLAAAAWSL